MKSLRGAFAPLFYFPLSFEGEGDKGSEVDKHPSYNICLSPLATVLYYKLGLETNGTATFRHCWHPP